MLPTTTEQNQNTTTTTTTTSTQLHAFDLVGCIKIEDIHSSQQELVNRGFDLKMEVNQSQNLRRLDKKHEWIVPPDGERIFLTAVPPLFQFCSLKKFTDCPSIIFDRRRLYPIILK